MASAQPAAHASTTSALLLADRAAPAALGVREYSERRGSRAMIAGSARKEITCGTHVLRSTVFHGSARGRRATSPAPLSNPRIAENSSALSATARRRVAAA